jgi:uncharacterized protein YyaL (SSP411 family)
MVNRIPMPADHVPPVPPDDGAGPRENLLAQSSSPYLRQHRFNPVDWRPWGPEAFAEAKRRDVPVLVSIGYSTCHWCHVMAHECFEDPATAAYMNAELVCIKVDREEHPEVDAIYMDAVQALHGHGGWPLNAFTDHQGRPFYALTYVPQRTWHQLIGQLSALWRDDRGRIARSATDLVGHLADQEAVPGVIDEAVWIALNQSLVRTYDARNPGYAWNPDKAPKFPSSQLLPLLVASRPDWATQAEAVLEAMQDAGIHDRVGGGFHRYSVDKHWRLPHFEKMLYDNAQLMGVYARTAAVRARPDFLRTAINTGDYLLRDMRVLDAAGAFIGYASAEDADDPGGEGSFYAWSPSQLREVLGEADAARLVREWDIMAGHAETGPSGHPEPVLGHIPHPRGTNLQKHAASLPDEPGDVQALRASWEPFYPRLRAARDARPRPGRDDKVLTDQNALALEGFALLSRYTGLARFVEATRELAGILRTRQTPDGLLRLPGRPAYITDYGSFVAGMCAAFDLLGNPALITAAEQVADEAITRLRADDGGFHSTPAGREDLVRRGREWTDNAWPGGQNALALGLMRLSTITGKTRWRDVAEGIFAAAANPLREHPAALATLLMAWRNHERGHLSVVVTGAQHDPTTVALLALARKAVDPALAIIPVAACRDQDWLMLEGRRDITEPLAFVCIGDACLLPAKNTEELTQRLVEARA